MGGIHCRDDTTPGRWQSATKLTEEAVMRNSLRNVSGDAIPSDCLARLHVGQSRSCEPSRIMADGFQMLG